MGMEIGAVQSIAATPSTGDASARREMPLDTRRSDARSAAQRDAFRPSLRTPLDADRILAARRDGATGAETSARTESSPAATLPVDGNASDAAPPVAGATGTTESDHGTEGSSLDGRGGSGAPEELSQDEQREVARLERRDAQVRAHEQAHLSAAGGLARGGATFDYETGPDGKRYAVGGEVHIAMKSGRTPEETIRNAEQVRSAALAPADPSSVDLQTAAAAAQAAQEARQQLSKERAGAADRSGGDAPGEDRDRTEDAKEASAGTRGGDGSSPERAGGFDAPGNAPLDRASEQDSLSPDAVAETAPAAPPAPEPGASNSAQPSSMSATATLERSEYDEPRLR